MSVEESAEQAATRLMELALLCLEQAVPSRANSLAKTNLEQAMLWSNKDQAGKPRYCELCLAEMTDEADEPRADDEH